MAKYGAKQLFRKYQQGEATDGERLLLEQLFEKDLKNSDHTVSQQRITKAHQRTKQHLMQHIGLPDVTSKPRQLWPRFAAAASILLFLSVSSYFFLHKAAPSVQSVQNRINDVAPGDNKAILTLANGTTIALNKAGIGLLAQQGNNAIKKTLNGEIIYSQSDQPESQYPSQNNYNSIAIPKGGEYQALTLPDGTHVWINSASTLRYPTSFTGNERKVELAGEAYFEVKHDAAKPFRVMTKNQTVEVLGTHFNINAYADEPSVKTTLLLGRVKVTASGNNQTRILQPGQQSELLHNSFSISQVDTDPVVSWKNGQFMFADDDIQSIMRIISRWYDVEIVYKGSVPDDRFGGGLSRFKNVSEVLNTLQLTGKVHFTIEGRKITVSK